MEATLYDFLGKEIQKDPLGRGSVIGLVSLGLSERSNLQVQATEPTTAIRLTLSDLLRLTSEHAEFQLAMFRLAASVFKRYLMVEQSLPKPSVVGIIHHSEASRPLVGRLARRLQDLDESPCIAGDDERWKPDGDIPFKLLDGEGRDVRQDILKDWASHRRFLVDFRADHSPEAMMRVLRSEEHTSELQSHLNLVCRLLLEKKNTYPHPPRPLHRPIPLPLLTREPT